MATLGLIAGEGKLPFQVADQARADGERVVAVAFRGSASPDLAEHVDRFYWVGLARLGSIIRYLKREGATSAVMAGRVHHRHAIKPLKIVRHLPDWSTLVFWYRRLHGDLRADAILTAFADALGDQGIEVESSVERVPHLTIEPGCLTRRQPTQRERRDIKLGWHVAKAMGGLDVGQAVIVKEGVVVAVEAVEGTDETIQRGGELGHGGVVVVKVAKPNQDLRFDVPTVGVGTVKAMIAGGARVLAIEAGKTLLLEQDRFVRAADEADLTVIACTNDEMNG